MFTLSVFMSQQVQILNYLCLQAHQRVTAYPVHDGLKFALMMMFLLCEDFICELKNPGAVLGSSFTELSG